MLFASAAPLAGIEISADALKGVRLAEKGRNLAVAGRAAVELPAGLVKETFSRPNVADGDVFKEHLQRLCAALGIQEHRIGLALPDATARVHILAFETLPRRERELRDIIVWRLKRDNLLPFEPEAARIVYQIMGQAKGASGAIDVLVSIIRQDVLDQYVSLFEQSSLEPMVVDVASFHRANFYHDEMRRTAPATEAQALIHLSEKRSSLMVFGGDALAFFRSREINAAAAGEAGTEDAVTRALQASLNYYQEHRNTKQAVAVFFVSGHEKRMDWCAWLKHESGVRLVPLEPERYIQREEAVATDPAGEYAAATGAAQGR